MQFRVEKKLGVVAHTCNSTKKKKKRLLKRHVVSSATERRCSCSTAIVSLSQQKEGLPYNTALGEFPNSLQKYECWDHVTVRYRKVI
jgi:hypothetical protein